MKKSINKVTKKVGIKFTKVKTGTVEDFFASVKRAMRSADRAEATEKRCATLTFADPTEMLHFLSAAKIKLINSIRMHPDTVTNIAKIIKRNRSSVYRDISELQQFGLVRIHEEINPKQGRHKIVELTSSLLKLEAII